MSSSIKEYGVFQPIIAKKSIKGYEIVAGERRVLASRMAGLDKIPAIVKEFSDEEMMEIALLENLQRENLNAMEEAMAYKKIQQSLNITQEELAKKVGKSRSHVTNMMGLLNLPEEVKDMILTKEISMGHARILSKLDDKEQIKKLANDVIEKKLSVRQLEDITNSPIDFQRKKEIKRKEREGSEYSYIENALCDKLGTKVRIKKNKVEIKFENAADLTRLLEIMQLDK